MNIIWLSLRTPNTPCKTKKGMFILFCSLLFLEQWMSIHFVDVHVFDHVLRNLFYSRYFKLSYIMQMQKNNKNDDFTSMMIVLVGHANAVTISSYIVCECTWYGDWRVAVVRLLFRFTRWLNSLAWGQTNKTIYSWNWDGWHHEYTFVMITQCLCFDVFCLDYDAKAAIKYWYHNIFISSETQTLEECWRTFWSRPKQRVEQRLASMNVPSFWIRTYNWLL